METQGKDSVPQTRTTDADSINNALSKENVPIAVELEDSTGPQTLTINESAGSHSENSMHKVEISKNHPPIEILAKIPVLVKDNDKPDNLHKTFQRDANTELSIREMKVISDAHIATEVPDNENIQSEIVNMEINEGNTSRNYENFNCGTLKSTKNPVELFTEDTGPQLYEIKGNIVTAPVITKNLPEMFKDLPIFGRPNFKSQLNDFYEGEIRKFVGCDLNDNEFEELANYCSPENLKTGNELLMTTNFPHSTLLTNNLLDSGQENGHNLCTIKKYKMRVAKDVKGAFSKKLKYRSMRVLPYPQEDAVEVSTSEDMLLEPGKDILFRVRVYRPYCYVNHKERLMRTRHSLLCSDMILTGRHCLTALRDRFVCHNDFDMRVDVSNNPDLLPKTKAKDVFPSGFLFINNVFYVDTREGCIDYSQPIRDWAIKRGIGEFQKRDMCQTRLDEVIVKIGYPDVYLHQGNCEHVFVFSEVRLLNARDPLRFSLYPCSTVVGQNQIMYCTTCAEFSAKWIVAGCSRIPFDPAYFCDTCFRQYLYKDGQKIGEFKAYTYRGNALNILKPQ